MAGHWIYFGLHAQSKKNWTSSNAPNWSGVVVPGKYVTTHYSQSVQCNKRFWRHCAITHTHGTITRTSIEYYQRFPS